MPHGILYGTTHPSVVAWRFQLTLHPFVILEATFHYHGSRWATRPFMVIIDSIWASKLTTPNYTTHCPPTLWCMTIASVSTMERHHIKALLERFQALFQDRCFIRCSQDILWRYNCDQMSIRTSPSNAECATTTWIIAESGNRSSTKIASCYSSTKRQLKSPQMQQ